MKTLFWNQGIEDPIMLIYPNCKVNQLIEICHKGQIIRKIKKKSIAKAGEINKNKEAKLVLKKVEKISNLWKVKICVNGIIIIFLVMNMHTDGDNT